MLSIRSVDSSISIIVFDWLRDRFYLILKTRFQIESKTRYAPIKWHSKCHCIMQHLNNIESLYGWWTVRCSSGLRGGLCLLLEHNTPSSWSLFYAYRLVYWEYILGVLQLQGLRAFECLLSKTVDLTESDEYGEQDDDVGNGWRRPWVVVVAAVRTLERSADLTDVKVKQSERVVGAGSLKPCFLKNNQRFQNKRKPNFGSWTFSYLWNHTTLINATPAFKSLTYLFFIDNLLV